MALFKCKNKYCSVECKIYSQNTSIDCRQCVLDGSDVKYEQMTDEEERETILEMLLDGRSDQKW